MGNLFLDNRLFPTDLLFRNFFDTNTTFQSHVDSKPNYPVDIATTDAGLIGTITEERESMSNLIQIGMHLRRKEMQ